MIRGSTVFTPADLFATYRDRLGEPVTRESVRDIAQRVAALYRDAGYVEPQIRVDDALLAVGVLRIDIEEARISGVSIRGDAGPHRARLERLGAELAQDPVLRRSDLQATLRHMRELPGLSVAATTVRDEDEPRAYRLELDADFEAVGGAVRFSNRGTEEIGPNFVLGQVVANGLLGGRTSAGFLFGAATDYDEYHGLGLLGSWSIDSRTTLSASGMRSRSDPRETGVDRDIHYLRDRLSVRFQRQLHAEDGRTFALAAALEWDDLGIALSGQTVRDEHLRLLSSGGRWDGRGRFFGRYHIAVDAVKGLDGLGSALDARDLASDPRREDFVLFRLTFAGTRPLGDRVTARLDAFAQQTAYVLPYTQRFKIGGDRLGRGFEIPEIAGDQGIGAKLEVRRRLSRGAAWLGQPSFYGFYDIAAAWKQDVPGRESAATAGVGFAVQRPRMSAAIEVAQPLTRVDIEGRDGPSVFFELTQRL
ncbi:MAG TPA: ShlB/FhaC/HecB family hemolysin secretion/activation protein [Gammaproteobacteria bacterium]